MHYLETIDLTRARIFVATHCIDRYIERVEALPRLEVETKVRYLVMTCGDSKEMKYYENEPCLHIITDCEQFRIVLSYKQNNIFLAVTVKRQSEVVGKLTHAKMQRIKEEEIRRKIDRRAAALYELKKRQKRRYYGNR